MQPWTEAVVSVTDPSAASRLFTQLGGWRVTGRGAIARAELNYWRLPRTAGGSFLRICAPAANTGCVRFVRFTGIKQRPVRLAARPWDTGGIFSLMVRSDDVATLFERAIALGWWAESEPVGFSFGGSALRNVVLTGPHGINLAVYERSAPPFTAFPLGLISQGFNSMRMVRDARASSTFYRDGLGFNTVFDQDYLDPKPGPNNFSLPHNLTPTVARRAAALQPGRGETGRVEVMQFVGLTGKNQADHAQPPNLGILSVRYPVRGLSAYRARLDAQRVAISFQGRAIPVGGLGEIDLIGVRDPDGAITEFYESRTAQPE